MWLIFAFLALLAFASADLLGKKKVDSGKSSAPMEMLLSVLVLAFFIGLVLLAFGWGESGDTPWRLLWNHPLLLANQLCFLMYWLLYLVSFRHIGLALESAVSGANGILYFFGLLVINAVSGKLSAVNDVFHPVRLIPVLLVLTFTFLFPNIELFACHGSEDLRGKKTQERHRTVIGLLILFAGLLFDAGDTLITTLIFDDTGIGIMDFVMTSYFLMILPIGLFSLLLRRKNGKWFIPFKNGEQYSICYPCVVILSSLLYLYASSLDAVKTGILFIAAPVFPIIGAELVLKEKYTWRQNLCIWMIAIAAIAFGAADYIS